jgi:protein-L-isoaspartate(D-aspartate) O-methyltransferase
MVVAIRTDVRKVAEAADTISLEQALTAVGSLPREEFVSAEGRSLAYLDLPQNIGFGQTISDPYIVAVMTGALQLPPGADVLDVGTGSGYQAAVLAKVARQVSSIEIVPELAASAAIRLKRLGFANVEVRSGDGFAGWPEHAPFDGIVVAAGAAEVPRPLIDQLKPGGRLVMPIGPTAGSEQLLVVTKQPDGSLSQCSLGPAMFVPLTGRGAAPRAQFGQVYPAIQLCHGAPVT